MIRGLMLLVVLLLAPPAFGAVAFDASMTGGNSGDGFNQECAGATSCSSTGMTVGGSGTLLIAALACGSSSQVTGVTATWNGTSMTVVTNSAITSGVSAALAYLVNPTTGNKTLAMAWTGANDCYMSAVSFTGTDTTTGVQAADNTTATDTTSIAVPASSDGATVAVFAVDGSTPTLSQTKIFAEAPLAPGGAATYATGGSGTVTHSFTGAGGTAQRLVGLHVIAGAGASNTAGPLIHSPILKGLVGGGLIQ